MRKDLTYIDNEFNRIWLDDGIIHAEYKPGLVIDLRIAETLVKNRKAISNGRPFPLCGDVRNLVQISAEARKYLGSIEACADISILAVILKNPFQRAIFNFFQRFKSSNLVMRAFTTKESAMFWLKQKRFSMN